MKLFLIAICFLFITSQSSHALFNKKEDYLALRAHKVNARTGPGKKYPIKYYYQIKLMPIKKLGEYDDWYQIEDKNGDVAWISSALIRKIRTGIIITDEEIVYKKRNVESKPIFRLEKNVVVNIIKCYSRFCKIKVNDKKGYIKKSSIWGNLH